MRKKEGNKEQDVLSAAIKVFAKVGYFNAKIHNIADEAGIASGTVYLYFKSKEEILQKIFTSVWENLFSQIEKIDCSENDPAIKVHRMIDSVFDMFDANPALALVFVNEQHHMVKKGNKYVLNNYQKTLKVCEKVLNEGVRNRVFSTTINPIIFSTFFFGGIRYLLQQWAQDTRKMDLKCIRENLKELILNGIT